MAARESPPGKEESGPRDRDRTRNSSTTTNASIARQWRGHRYFIEHRAICFALDKILPRTPEPIEPNTFSLTERELRAHARDLYRAGWSVEEIRSVLDIEPVAP